MKPIVEWEVTNENEYFVDLELDGAVIALSLREAQDVVKTMVEAMKEIQIHMKENNDGEVS